MNRLSPGSPHTLRSLTSVMVTVLIVFGCARTGRSSADSDVTNNPASLRILAYNIRHGLGMDDSVDLKRSAQLIRSIKPDVVTLQEIDNRTERTGYVDQTAVLAELTGMHGVFGSFMDYQGGQYGMALLSRFPIIEYQNHPLPDGREPRSALAARVIIEPIEQEIIVVGIHLYATEEERLAQGRTILQLFENESTPIILSGDFNSEPDSEVMRLFNTVWTIPNKGVDNLTFPSDEPSTEIDFILYRPDNMFRVSESRAIHEPLVSDHRPVLLTLEITESR
ncbi:MAG: endonuclease/exonuclease/phosphatase family protein [Gemmatimonadota bacterium]|nr:MAG: endonuclease/exonuclease/phosphatase family protein [Gemmatimonadota bacterium]